MAHLLEDCKRGQEGAQAHVAAHGLHVAGAVDYVASNEECRDPRRQVAVVRRNDAHGLDPLVVRGDEALVAPHHVGPQVELADQALVCDGIVHKVDHAVLRFGHVLAAVNHQRLSQPHKEAADDDEGGERHRRQSVLTEHEHHGIAELAQGADQRNELHIAEVDHLVDVASHGHGQVTNGDGRADVLPEGEELAHQSGLQHLPHAARQPHPQLHEHDGMGGGEGDDV
mmetsp:Transcript_97199/g.308329  ORF Transcript_97199/g.308329 Transcript_97199/m.308329 type:complete len:227 (-) Transcript_97199:871-1551(-)